MGLKTIPTRPDLFNYSLVTELDGVIFILSLRYNTRMTRWILDIQDVEGNNLLLSLPLVSGVNFLGQYNIEGIPEGAIMVANFEDNSASPTRFELGDDKKAQLIYIEA